MASPDFFLVFFACFDGGKGVDGDDFFDASRTSWSEKVLGETITGAFCAGATTGGTPLTLETLEGGTIFFLDGTVFFAVDVLPLEPPFLAVCFAGCFAFFVLGASSSDS